MSPNTKGKLFNILKIYPVCRPQTEYRSFILKTSENILQQKYMEKLKLYYPMIFFNN